MSSTQPGKPVKVFYQQVVSGDIQKFHRKSNLANTGGGARDLRVSPNKDFWDPLETFFPTKKNSRERTGIILSEADTSTKTVTTSLMAPTDARPNECRICKIFEIDGWEISEQDFTSKKNSGYEWFYLLILDDKNQVWASKFCTDIIDSMDDKIANPIKAELAKKKPDTIRGIAYFK